MGLGLPRGRAHSPPPTLPSPGPSSTLAGRGQSHCLAPGDSSLSAGRTRWGSSPLVSPLLAETPRHLQRGAPVPSTEDTQLWGLGCHFHNDSHALSEARPAAHVSTRCALWPAVGLEITLTSNTFAFSDRLRLLLATGVTWSAVPAPTPPTQTSTVNGGQTPRHRSLRPGGRCSQPWTRVPSHRTLLSLPQLGRQHCPRAAVQRGLRAIRGRGSGHLVGAEEQGTQTQGRTSERRGPAWSRVP